MWRSPSGKKQGLDVPALTHGELHACKTGAVGQARCRSARSTLAWCDGCGGVWAGRWSWRCWRSWAWPRAGPRSGERPEDRACPVPRGAASTPGRRCLPHRVDWRRTALAYLPGADAGTGSDPTRSRHSRELHRRALRPTGAGSTRTGLPAVARRVVVGGGTSVQDPQGDRHRCRRRCRRHRSRGRPPLPGSISGSAFEHEGELELELGSPDTVERGSGPARARRPGGSLQWLDGGTGLVLDRVVGLTVPGRWRSTSERSDVRAHPSDRPHGHDRPSGREGRAELHADAHRRLGIRRRWLRRELLDGRGNGAIGSGTRAASSFTFWTRTSARP